MNAGKADKTACPETRRNAKPETVAGSLADDERIAKLTIPELIAITKNLLDEIEIRVMSAE